MVGLFQSFLHPRESFSLASKGWPTAEAGGTPPRGFQRLGVPLEGGTGTEGSLSLRAGRGLAGLVTLLPPSGSAGSDWGSLALVAASGSGTPLLLLERLQMALATGTLRLRSGCMRFPFPWQLQGGAREELGAGQVLQLIAWEELRQALPVLLASTPWFCLEPRTRTSSHLQTEWAQKLRTLTSALHKGEVPCVWEPLTTRKKAFFPAF